MNNQSPNYTLFSPVHILLFLVLFMILGMLVGSGFAYAIAMAQGIDLTQIEKMLVEQNSPALRNSYRVMVLLQHLFLFLFPAVLATWLFFRKSATAFLKIEKAPNFRNLLFSVLFLVAAFPLASWLIQPGMWLAERLPESLQWLGTAEEESTELIEVFLGMESPWELILTIMVMGLAPALGEELLFRGIVQQEFQKWFGNHHVAIIAAAFLFSCAHFQLQRFFSFWVLGIAIGYIFYWTKNLWIPIIVHFINNSFQVIVAYLYPGELKVSDMEGAGEISPSVLLISLIFVPLFAHYLRRS